jgi:benzoyl-CoA reductase/2-hydroxyglutaryl-CoA dehydratase subunit BcrC/BadD/HgdB
MAHRKSKGSHKKHKSKKHRAKNNIDNIYTIEEENAKKVGEEVYGEAIMSDSLEANVSDIHTDENATQASSDTGAQTNPKDSTNNTDVNNNASDTNVNNDNDNTNTDLNDFCEEIKEKQQEIFDKLKNLSDALATITLIRDNVNSIRVDTLTELYFTRQVRPLLDALNIISFASTNMSATATAFQTNAFGERKEIKEALKLSYKMNGEVDDIINSLGRRLTIFLKQIDSIDKNCPPFDSRKDS